LNPAGSGWRETAHYCMVKAETWSKSNVSSSDAGPKKPSISLQAGLERRTSSQERCQTPTAPQQPSPAHSEEHASTSAWASSPSPPCLLPCLLPHPPPHLPSLLPRVPHCRCPRPPPHPLPLLLRHPGCWPCCCCCGPDHDHGHLPAPLCCWWWRLLLLLLLLHGGCGSPANSMCHQGGHSQTLINTSPMAAWLQDSAQHV